MTQTGYLATNASPDPSVPSLLDVALMVGNFFSRHRKLIYLCIVLGLAFGNIYMAVTRPTYTAGASLILDMRNVQFDNPKPMVADVSLDSAFVESQVEIVKSRAVETAVIRRLDLTSRPEFVKSTGGLLGDVIDYAARHFGGAPPPSEFELMERALRTFDSRLSVKRIGLSFIIEIAFRSSDPDLAAARDQGRRRLEKEQRLSFRGDVAELGGVLAVVAAHADDLGGGRRRVGRPERDPLHGCQASSVSSPAKTSRASPRRVASRIGFPPGVNATVKVTPLSTLCSAPG